MLVTWRLKGTGHMVMEGFAWSHGDRGEYPGRMVIEGIAWSHGDRGMHPVTW